VTPTVLHQFTFAALNSRIRHIVFKNTEYVLSNWTLDKFPNVIYLNIAGMNGYKKVIKDINGQFLSTDTTRVAALELVSFTATMDESNVRTYELKYSIKDSVVWEIPVALETFAITVTVDDEIVA
jgi:hypothetical protein